MIDENYVKEKKRRRKGVIWSVIALVAVWFILFIGRTVVDSWGLTFFSVVLIGISTMVLLVSMWRYGNI